MNTAFTGFTFKNKGLIYDYIQNKFPTRLYEYSKPGKSFEVLQLDKNSTYFVFQYTGYSELISSDKPYQIIHSQYFGSVPGKDFDSILIFGQAIIIQRIDFTGMFFCGGPIEASGRLKYIDGCTDSLLIPPVKFGDPCLNALFFPPNINQTQHTHPSMRVGMVIRGKGECITPDEVIPLLPGTIFIIHEDGLHSFRTFEDEGMVVIAYHPDSDFGPKDEDHPMVNRTMVEGKSAKDIPEIQTK